MAKGIYVGGGGIARKTTQPYRGVDGVARKVTSGYVGVDGVARQFHPSIPMVTWNKYSATSKTSYGTHKTYSPGAGGSYSTSLFKPTSQLTVGTGVSFSTSSGLSLTGSTKIVATDVVGYYYRISSTKAGKISASNTISSGSQKILVQITNECFSFTTYSKGSTSYGTVQALPGELPEEGTFVSGSATGSYCVVKVGSTNYYYTKA